MMRAFAEALGAWPGAAWLRGSATAYLVVNAAHILGIALLVGSILPLDLRLLGLFRSAPLAALAPVLIRCAAFGLTFALLTGLWLLSVKPVEYLENPAFLTKLALLLAAGATIAAQHANPAARIAMAGGEVRPSVRVAAASSLVLWLAVLLAGRWIGFA